LITVFLDLYSLFLTFLDMSLDSCKTLLSVAGKLSSDLQAKYDFVNRCQQEINLTEIPHTRNRITLAKALVVKKNTFDENSSKRLYDAFVKMRVTKKIDYLRVNSPKYNLRKNTKLVPTCVHDFMSLIAMILMCSESPEDDVSKYCNSAKLTKEQMFMVIYWFIPYIPEHCYTALLQVTEDINELIEFWKTVLEHGIIARRLDEFDLEKLYCYQTDSNGCNVVKNGVRVFDASKNQFNYFLFVGIFWNRGNVNNAKMHIKIGCTYSNKTGLGGRFQNHFDGDKYIDITALSAYESVQAHASEGAIHKSVADYKYQDEVFAFRRAITLYKCINNAYIQFSFAKKQERDLALQKEFWLKEQEEKRISEITMKTRMTTRLHAKKLEESRVAIAKDAALKRSKEEVDSEAKKKILAELEMKANVKSVAKARARAEEEAKARARAEEEEEARAKAKADAEIESISRHRSKIEIIDITNSDSEEDEEEGKEETPVNYDLVIKKKDSEIRRLRKILDAAGIKY
jgi:hypothetical protein